MFSYIYHTLISTPLYNGLILLMDALPWADAGIAIVLFTIIIKFILFPLSKKSVVTQIRMRQIEPQMAAIREQYKNDRQRQALETMNLYRTQGINPFSGILLVLIQLPIIFALYSIFLHSGLPTVNTDLLYPFVKVPVVDMVFLGFVNIANKSLFLSIVAALCQYLQIRLTIPKTPPKAANHVPSFQDDLARSMNAQMKYVFPLIILFIAYKASVTVALYLIVSSLFTIGQELWIRRSVRA